MLDEGDLPRLFGAVLPRRLNARRGGLVLHLLQQGQRIPAQEQGDHHHDHRARAAQGHADGQAPLILDVLAFAAFLPTHDVWFSNVESRRQGYRDNSAKTTA